MQEQAGMVAAISESQLMYLTTTPELHRYSCLPWPFPSTILEFAIIPAEKLPTSPPRKNRLLVMMTELDGVDLWW